MGNSQSTQTPSPQSLPKDATTAAPQTPKRKESLGGLSSKGAAVPPLASLESATGQPSQATSSSTALPRGRSSTLAGSTTKPSETPSVEKIEHANTSLPDRPRSVPLPPSADTSNPIHNELEPLSRTASSNQYAVSESSAPALYPPSSQFGRPPRLPLPIEEEPYMPDPSPLNSPTILPTNPTLDDIKIELDPSLDRTRSILSVTTGDEDEDEGDDAVYTGAEDQGPLVDTLVEWKEGGDKVYVTGTFCDWLKKSRLHKHGPSKDPNAHSAIIALPTGAMYLSFLVDGVAKTASHMPTTVDFTNALVNYLHVPPPNTEEALVLQDEDARPASAESMRQAKAPASVPASNDAHHIASTGRNNRVTSPEVGERKSSPPQSQISTSRASSGDQKARPAPTTPPKEPESLRKPLSDKKHKRPDKTRYHSVIPAYLLDWDAPENSSRVRRANAVNETHQPPPQLPPYLQKSILSTMTPAKDDSSVLAFPNHTVLNHLATSSIKDGTLGTSATTRYRNKFVTTIMYMPTSLH